MALRTVLASSALGLVSAGNCEVRSVRGYTTQCSDCCQTDKDCSIRCDCVARCVSTADFASEANASKTMQAAVLTDRSLDMKLHIEKIQVKEVKVPRPGVGEVLLKVHASSVNPVDTKITESPLQYLWHFPHALGFDVAGVVESCGLGGCSRLEQGDEVYAEATTILEAIQLGGGTWSEYAVVAERVLAKKPSKLSWAEAGAMPMVALTGLQNLEWAADPDSKRLDNMTVVVLGGSGGTGHVGIQIAKALGAKEVITTCGPDHLDFVKSLGADRAINYHEQNWYDVLPNRSVDVVYDCVGLKGSGDQAFPKLKQGGRLASLLSAGLAGKEALAERPDIKQFNTNCIGNAVQHDRMEVVSQMVEAGQLKVHVDRQYNLSDVQAAVTYQLSGHTTGKVAIIMHDAEAPLTLV